MFGRTLAPGENHISVPVDDLYRGEGAARNRGDIKRNLDADQINFISFTFAGKAAFGDLFLDNFHFIKGGAAVATVESGTPSSTSPVTPIPSTAVAPVRPAAKAPVAPPGTYVWADFEKPSDIGYWEVRLGLPPKRLPQFATSGSHTMELRGGYELATYNMPKDWSGHDTFAFDVYNPGEGLRQIELTIGDQAFSQQQDYWNRHNAVIAIVPGANTIEIPVEGLYRGEAGARNRVIKRNLDANQIFLVVLKIRGRYKDGPLFLDNMRLVKGDVVPGAPNVSLNNVASTPTPTPAPTPAPPPVVVAAPPPPAATAPTARPSAPITAPGGDLVWESFESQSDVGRWEIRQGLPVVPEPNNVTHGSNAARVFGGNMLATYNMPRDWTGYQAFEFDVFNTGQKLHKLELVIGDDAWIANQDYWNRHNAVYMLVPGENTISVPVDGLYRGEAGARNRSIKRNIDINQIHFVSFTFQGRGRDGRLFMDNLRLVQGDGSDGVVVGSSPSPVPAPAPAPSPAPAAPSIAPATPSIAPAAPSPAPTVVPVSPQGVVNADGDLVWESFETMATLSKWEVRTGLAPKCEPIQVTHGENSLRIFGGNLLATYSMPRDWTGYEALEFDVFNTGQTLHKIEVLIGDDAWIANQDYWNRHNAVYMLVPGENTISIPVNGLYRGEAGARNRSIKRNIDVNQIHFFSIAFQGRGRDGRLYLDNLRLSKGEGGGASLQSVPAATPTRSVLPEVVPVSAPLRSPAPSRPAEGKADLVLDDFEDQNLFGANWELRTGNQPQVVSDHKTSGSNALKVHPGNFICSTKLQADWRGYEALEFDIFNSTEQLMKLEFVVGDAAWTEQPEYWNRHNAIYMLVPGENTISIPVAGLYRGEAGARNRNIKRNIDADKIAFLSFWFHGSAKLGPLFLDNLRLVAGDGGAAVVASNPQLPGTPGASVTPSNPPASSPAQSQVWGFDFGPKDQALWPGFQGVTWNTLYSKETGYGLEKSQGRSRYAGDTTWPTRLLQDFVWIPFGEFFVDLPNGKYDVWVFFEDSGYWAEEHSQHTKRYIYAEGKEVDVVDRSSWGMDGESRYLFEHFEPQPDMDVLRYYWEKLYQPRAFTTEVNDGQLNLGVYSEEHLSARVAAVVIHKSGDQQAVAWKKNLLEKNYREMRSKAAMHPFPKTSGLEALPPEELQKPCIAFIPDFEQNLILTGGPTPEQLGRNLQRIGAQGETVSATFALRPNKSFGKVAASCAGLTGKNGQIDSGCVEIFAVRHMGKRPFGDRSFKVIPWYLSNPDQVELKEGITRQFWVNVNIPPDTASGKYTGEVHIQAGATIEKIQLQITVLPFSLARPDLPISFFNMPADSLEFFAKYGMTAVNGGPRIKFKQWNHATKMPRLDFTEVDAYLAKAKELGMDLEVMDYNGPITVDGISYHNAFEFFKEKGRWVKLEPLEAGKRVFDAIKQHADEQNWPSFTYNMVDEPLSRDNTKACLGNIKFMRAIAPWMKLVGYYGFSLKNDRLGNDELFKALDGSICKFYNPPILDYAKANDKNIYLYSLGRTRYTYGPYLFRHRLNGVKGYVQWHSSIIHGYQFFDLDGREPDDGVIVYRSEGIRPTLDLERIRMGINDFRYLLTLEQKIAAAKESGRGEAEVAAAQGFLDELFSKITKDSRGKPGWLELDQMRMTATRHILLLKKHAGV